MTIIIALLLSTANASTADFAKPSYYETKRGQKTNLAVVGIVEKIFGNSFAKNTVKNARSNISLGYRVFERDQLETEKSRLHTRFKNGSYFELGENTVLEVERLRFKVPGEPDDSIYRFQQGVVRVVVTELQKLENFVIKTDAGLLRVAGQADFYLIQFKGAKDLTLRVSKGSVDLINTVTNDHITVRDRQAAYLKVNGLVSNAGLFTEEQRKFLESRTQI